MRKFTYSSDMALLHTDHNVVQFASSLLQDNISVSPPCSQFEAKPSPKGTCLNYSVYPAPVLLTKKQ